MSNQVDNDIMTAKEARDMVMAKIKKQLIEDINNSVNTAIGKLELGTLYKVPNTYESLLPNTISYLTSNRGYFISNGYINGDYYLFISWDKEYFEKYKSEHFKKN